VGGESYPVERVHVRGGERVVYHVNASGRVDFADIAATERTPAELFGNVLQWTERLSPDEVKQRLARSRVAVGAIKDLLPLEYGTSNRVLQLEIAGSEGNATIRGHQVRSALGLKESLFAIERERDEMNRITAFVFTGRGWGHGVGLCQMGAYALAKSGYSSLRILQKYYRGVKVQKVY
jgi:stage II sporulation protein D